MSAGTAARGQPPSSEATFFLTLMLGDRPRPGRGLQGVEFVVSDDHPGLKRAIAEVLPEAAWQRC